MKKGDRVRVCWICDYDAELFRYFGMQSPIGRTGTVVQTQFNPNMARYGMGNEVLVRMDNDDTDSIWIEKNLEIING